MIIKKPDDENQHGLTTRRRVLASSGALAAAGFAGCLGTDDGGDGDGGDGSEDRVAIHMPLLEASMYVPVIFYGRDHDLWRDRGIDLTVEVTGFGQFTRSFTDEQAEGLSTLSALVLAENAATGVPVKIFGQHMNFFNQCFVQEGSDIQDVPDLEGRSLGVPGLGSSTTRSYMALWQDIYGFDLENDPSEVVPSDTATIHAFLKDGEIDAAVLFTSFTIASLADPELRSIFNPDTGWREATGYPPSVNILGVYDDFVEENPQVVLDWWDGWVEAVGLFRDEFDEAISRYGAIGGLGVEEEDELAVVEEMANNEELFPTEWDEDWIEQNMRHFDLVADLGGIESAPSRDEFLTHEEIEDMV